MPRDTWRNFSSGELEPGLLVSAEGGVAPPAKPLHGTDAQPGNSVAQNIPALSF